MEAICHLGLGIAQLDHVLRVGGGLLSFTVQNLVVMDAAV